MKSYSFDLNFQDEFSYLSQDKVLEDVKSLINHEGFVFGKNVKKINTLKLKGKTVKVKVSLLHEQTSDNLDKAKSDIINNLKRKMNYKLDSIDESSKKMSKSKKNTLKSSINNPHKNKKKQLLKHTQKVSSKSNSKKNKKKLEKTPKTEKSWWSSLF